VVASDRPANLAPRLAARSAVEVCARAPAGMLVAALEGVPGVRRVTIEDDGTATVRCRVFSEAAADVRPALAATVLAHGWDLLTLSRAEPSLEEIFLDLVDSGDRAT
jgi:hypothetical protein